MSETYNPSERTFIKKAPDKICPSCGQLVPPEHKAMTNHMNNYVNDTTKAVICMNRHEDYITLKDVVWRRSDVKVATKAAEVKASAPAASLATPLKATPVPVTKVEPTTTVATPVVTTSTPVAPTT